MAYRTLASSIPQTNSEIEIQTSPRATSDGASSSSTAVDSNNSSSNIPYDVFINHRGEVKKTFAAHLYRALLSRGLRPFLDQQDLQEGLPFPSQLSSVIGSASIHVAIFSPKYAESRWCLDELLLMLGSGAPIIPVFYQKLERLPDSFGCLSNLKYFDARLCSNLTISSETFGNIRTLEHIDLEDCEKVEVWPSQVAHQRSLKTLKLTGTNFKELPSAFELPKHLEVLWIGNPLLETVMHSLGDLPNLKELGVEYRGDLKCLSASVERSSQLSWLKVAACPISHTSEVLFDDVVYCSLREFTLEECFNVVEIGTLPMTLTSVRLDRCYNLRSIEGLRGLPKLRVLHIEMCDELEELPNVKTLVSLERLSVFDCVKLKSIRNLAQLTKLVDLTVQGCPQLGELEGVAYCTSLRYLSVNGCPKLRLGEKAQERLRQKCDIFDWGKSNGSQD